MQSLRATTYGAMVFGFCGLVITTLADFHAIPLSEFTRDLILQLVFGSGAVGLGTQYLAAQSAKKNDGSGETLTMYPGAEESG